MSAPLVACKLLQLDATGLQPKVSDMHALDPAYLHECFEYDPGTGLLLWRHRPAHHFPTERGRRLFSARFAGRPAGFPHPLGYTYIRLGGRDYRAHRVAVALMTGADPQGAQIDHLNGRREDNRWCNLRVCTHTENMRNAKRRHDNRSGVTGVGWFSPKSTWRARINTDGRRTQTLGYSKDFFEAVCLRKSAEARLGYSERHGNHQH